MGVSTWDLLMFLFAVAGFRDIQDKVLKLWLNRKPKWESHSEGLSNPLIMDFASFVFGALQFAGQRCCGKIIEMRTSSILIMKNSQLQEVTVDYYIRVVRFS